MCNVRNGAFVANANRLCVCVCVCGVVCGMRCAVLCCAMCCAVCCAVCCAECCVLCGRIPGYWYKSLLFWFWWVCIGQAVPSKPLYCILTYHITVELKIRAWRDLFAWCAVAHDQHQRFPFYFLQKIAPSNTEGVLLCARRGLTTANTPKCLQKLQPCWWPRGAVVQTKRRTREKEWQSNIAFNTTLFLWIYFHLPPSANEKRCLRSYRQIFAEGGLQKEPNALYLLNLVRVRACHHPCLVYNPYLLQEKNECIIPNLGLHRFNK